MPWVRIDDHFDEHPKHAKAGPLGWALWMAGLAYSNRNLTDGFIPWAVAQSLVNWQFLEPADEQGRRKLISVGITCGMVGDDVTNAYVVDRLLDAGLWDECDGGYRIHDYPEYQPAKADVLAERARSAERQARYRERNASSNSVTHSEVTAEVTRESQPRNAGPVPNPVPVPNPDPKPVPKPITTKRKRAANAAVVDSEPFRFVSVFLEESGKDIAEAPQAWIDEQCAHAEALIATGCTEAQMHRVTRYVLSQLWRTSPVTVKTVRGVYQDWVVDGEPDREPKRGSPNGSPDPADIRRRNQPKDDDDDPESEAEREAWLAKYRPSKVSAD